MYQNCIFDLYGTLIDIRTDESGNKFWEDVADIYKTNGADYKANEIEQSYLKLAKKQKKLEEFLHPNYKHVDIDLTKVFKKLYTRKGVSPSRDVVLDTALKFRKASTQFIYLYDGVIELLESLKKAHKKIYLLSNAQRCFTYPELKEMDILKYFDGLLISSDCRCSKPSKEFFNILFKRFKLKKDDCVMIGNDCISDMLGAHNAGIDGVYIHQEISPPLEGKELICKHSILDGDVTKITEYLLKN